MPLQVTCAIIVQEHKILCVQRSAQMKLSLKWEFPGGKLEDGEAEEECIVREIKEELGLEIRVTAKLEQVFHDYGSFALTLIPFIAEIVSGTLVLMEHADYRWLEVEELMMLDWAEADLPIVEQVVRAFSDRP